MKKKLLGIVAIAGMMMLVGCGGVDTPKFKAPKSDMASSVITGDTLHVKYHINDDGKSGTYNPHEYFIYSSTSTQPLVATNSAKGKYPTIGELFKVDPQNVFIYGTVGDKVVFAFANGYTEGNRLAVYDFSDKKTYFLAGSYETYKFLQNGTSYVVKILKGSSVSRYIALNDLKEVKIDESGYKTLKFMGNTGYEKSVMSTRMTNEFVKVREQQGMLPPLLFGPQQQKVN